ncbi:MAG TPA: flagellar hook-associated protein FlgL [Baekduia sp.]|nr:flagellar hook-associated protein FlgL [Baekduia sp.]
MRITHGMLTDRLLADLRDRGTDIARLQREVSSGVKVAKPSDDPLAAREAVLSRETLDGVAGFRSGATAATSRLEATDTALGRIGDLLLRARELAVQGANDALSAADRQKIADELDQLAESAKESAGVQLAGAHLFSGTATTTAPYAPGSDVFQGNAAAVARQVGPGVSVTVNVSAGDVLGSGQGAADGKVLHTLRDLADHLRSGTPADLAAARGTDLKALIANADAVAAARAGVGTTQQRVDAAASRLDDLEDATRSRLADLVEPDLPETLARLTQQQTAYEAALRAGAQIVQPSLLDFLR